AWSWPMQTSISENGIIERVIREILFLE
ncbi:MAG: hypothetical protein DVB22_003122, partial [Verrucomicrobia bacterium]